MARTPISTIAQFAPLVIYIKGKVAFSRVASRIEGQELDAQNRQFAAKGRPQHAKPYITITINNPVILDNGRLPEQVKSVISERFFTRQDGTVSFTQESKSPFLPTVVYSAEAGELKGQGIADNNVPLQGELATGLDVTLGVDLFVMKGAYNNAGLGLKYILVNEPVRYFSRGSIASDLEAQGITYTAPVSTAPVVEQYQQPVYTAPQAYSAPASQASTVSQPQNIPVSQTMAPNQQQAYQQVKAAPQMQPAPWDDSELPFNQAPAQQAPGANQAVQRPVRFY